MAKLRSYNRTCAWAAASLQVQPRAMCVDRNDHYSLVGLPPELHQQCQPNQNVKKSTKEHGAADIDPLRAKCSGNSEIYAQRQEEIITIQWCRVCTGQGSWGAIHLTHQNSNKLGLTIYIKRHLSQVWGTIRSTEGALIRQF